MKNIILAGFLLLSAFTAFGQNAKEILSKSSEVISSMECVEVAFDFTATKASGELIGEQSGTFISQGNLFVVLTNTLDVYCDGSSKWIYDKENQEITVINHDPSLSDMTENPFSVFSSAVGDIYDYVGKPVKDGENWLIQMKPKDKKINYSLVELCVKASDFSPVSIKYTSKGGDVYYAEISSLTAIEPKADSFFIIDFGSLEDVIITDLR